MKPLGTTKRSHTLHPHNECAICSENDKENKGREKQVVKKEIQSQIMEKEQGNE